MTQQLMEATSDLLTTKEAAAYISSTPGSLGSSRATGHGPRFIKIGTAVFYRRADLDDYLANLKPYVASRRRNKMASPSPEKEKGRIQ